MREYAWDRQIVTADYAGMLHSFHEALYWLRLCDVKCATYSGLQVDLTALDAVIFTKALDGGFQAWIIAIGYITS